VDSERLSACTCTLPQTCEPHYAASLLLHLDVCAQCWHGSCLSRCKARKPPRRLAVMQAENVSAIELLLRRTKMKLMKSTRLCLRTDCLGPELVRVDAGAAATHASGGRPAAH
jgi:hypothetical protein